LTVREEVYQNSIEISGNIQAAQEQNIQAPGEGIVESVYVKEGDRVSRGQIIFQLNDTQERYNLADHDFKMNQERINGASAKLALMAEQRRVILKQIRDRRLEARFDGVVARLRLIPGTYAKPQDSFGSIIDRSSLKSTVEVVETDAFRLKAGQLVRLSFPSYPDLAVEGRVYSYPAVSRITSRGVAVLDTEIRITNPPAEILPGYSFSGEIVSGEAQRVLVLEREALIYEGGQAFVDRREPGGGEASFRRVPVEASSYGRDMVRLLAGLQAGDQVRPPPKAPSVFD
jgi:multidrug efflux pump subunit AcrA (membrane-fusion protein)